jgi:hypothetical protein
MGVSYLHKLLTIVVEEDFPGLPPNILAVTWQFFRLSVFGG